MSDAFDWLKHILSEQLFIPADRITTADRFDDDLGFDSLDAVELLTACEEEWGEISDEEAEAVRTVGDLVRLLDQKAARP